MQRRQFSMVVLAGGGVLWLPQAARALSLAHLSEGDAAAGIRAALERGAVSAVSLLGRADGFLGNPEVRISLPKLLQRAAKLMKMMGQGHKVDALVTGMNRAAEAAVPEARALLVTAAKEVSVDDALKIVRGGETSVTEYFARKTREPLTGRFLPIVTQQTERLALADQYNTLAGKAASAGLMKGEDANVQQYVTAKALDGLYKIIGDEEKKIRADPVGTGSAILKKVFGG